ncbi:MBL fold metallo-hydrolase [Alicyclobacillus sp. SO9]|uniref:MBL fold metallo-hydrolase n=1 Tax=Alicyclobacillus sp. SO9 TaxID=2665646 RepID=UPI0018E8DF45|nr:MBL fold metallo-hydrolase [Alicyclobacillus sp. SO9]QQE79015.1 MBL fold metallo-hydrolase [Alicyclobacillus sp. SO9]
MRLVVLGCWGGFPPAGGATSGYLVETKAGSILLDCGSGVLSQLSFYKPPFQVGAVILSHLHNDHVADLPVLQYALRTYARRGFAVNFPVPVYVPADADLSSLEHLEPEFKVIPVDTGTAYDILSARVTFAPTTHPVASNAVRLEEDGSVLVYSGDSEPDDNLTELALHADLLLCESTNVPESFHSSGRGHMGPIEAAQTAKSAQAKGLVLTHLPSDGDLLHARELARMAFAGPVELASVKSVYAVGEAE